MVKHRFRALCGEAPSELPRGLPVEVRNRGWVRLVDQEAGDRLGRRSEPEPPVAERQAARRGEGVMSVVILPRSRGGAPLSVILLELFPAALVVALLAAVGIVHVTSRVLVVNLGYELSKLDGRATDLERRNAELSVELATLKSPARLESLGEGERARRPRVERRPPPQEVTDARPQVHAGAGASLAVDARPRRRLGRRAPRALGRHLRPGGAAAGAPEGPAVGLRRGPVRARHEDPRAPRRHLRPPRHVPLAQSVDVDSVWVDPSTLSDPKALAQKARPSVLAIDSRELLERFAKGRRFAWVKRAGDPRRGGAGSRPWGCPSFAP